MVSPCAGAGLRQPSTAAPSAAALAARPLHMQAQISALCTSASTETYHVHPSSFIQIVMHGMACQMSLLLQGVEWGSELMLTPPIVSI